MGGQPQPVPACGPAGYEGPLESARQAEKLAAQGFRAVKAKIGYATVSDDVEVIRAMRSAVGGQVQSMVNCNQSMTVAEAVDRLAVLEECGCHGASREPDAHSGE